MVKLQTAIPRVRIKIKQRCKTKSPIEGIKWNAKNNLQKVRKSGKSEQKQLRDK